MPFTAAFRSPSDHFSINFPKSKNEKQLKMTTTESAKDVKDLKDIKEKIDLGLLEEDDEFEEFQAEGLLCLVFIESKRERESVSKLLFKIPKHLNSNPANLLPPKTGKRKIAMRICPSGKITGTTMTWKTISPSS